MFPLWECDTPHLPERQSQGFLLPHPSSLTEHPPLAPVHPHTLSAVKLASSYFQRKKSRVTGQTVPSTSCPLPINVRAFL